jgi:trehalose-6-phosphatase
MDALSLCTAPTKGDWAEAHPERYRVGLFSLPLGGERGMLCCGDDEHDPSGFDVPEHFRELEVQGQENHD